MGPFSCPITPPGLRGPPGPVLWGAGTGRSPSVCVWGGGIRSGNESGGADAVTRVHTVSKLKGKKGFTTLDGRGPPSSRAPRYPGNTGGSALVESGF